LNQLLQRLCDADIEFIVVGGFAGMLHGSSLVTRDLDVCAILTTGNVEKLRHAFRDLHPVHRLTPQRLSFLDNPAPGVGVENLYLQTDLGGVDLLTSITGVGDYAQIVTRSLEIELFGRRCRIMSIEDLIRAKEALNREKDRLAVKELRAIAAKRRQRPPAGSESSARDERDDDQQAQDDR
jgi:hypothetical protein